MRFIDGLIRATKAEDLKSLVPELVPKLISLIEDKDLTVRDAAIHTLGILKGTLSDDESILESFAELDQKTMAKIDKASQDIGGMGGLTMEQVS